MTADVASIRRQQGLIFAAELRSRWPKDTRKLAARALGVTQSTIGKLLSGDQPPSADLLNAGIALWGQKFAAKILAPHGGDWTSEWEMRAEIKAMREHLERIEARWKEAG